MAAIRRRWLCLCQVVDNGGNRVVNGGLVGRDPYYIDGAHNTNHVFGGSAVNPNPDVLQEFKVLTNSFSAQYGRKPPAASLISSTKSGTNRGFHGSAF